MVSLTWWHPLAVDRLSRERRRRRSLFLLAVSMIAGCATSLGGAGVLVPSRDAVGVKLLRPGLAGRSCGASVLGLSLRSDSPSVDEALRQILATDSEGNLVTNAELTWTQFITGLYNRRCITVRGDLGRSVSVISVPAPAGHAGHGGH